MKLFKRFKSKKGFTLTEVLVSIVIFALMSAIVMQILAIAITQHRKNDSVDKDMDTQISNLVQENALVERDTVKLVMKFVSPTGASNNLQINDAYNPLPTTERLSDGAILSAAQKIPALRRKSPRSAPFMPYNGEKGVNCHEKPPEK